MTLDEAIKHAEEVMIENLEKTKDRNASDPIAINCFECADEHRQIAEWLKELKQLKELKEQEPCEDAISRQAVDELSKNLVHITRDKADFLCKFWEGLQKMPPVTPQPKTGRWIEGKKTPGYIKWNCSECGLLVRNTQKPWYEYCPKCGVKMEVET